MKEGSLENFQPEGLQAYGVEDFANLLYRAKVAELLASRFNAEQLLVFDDVAFAVPEAQRPKLHALPGYERATLPALLLAPGFEKGTSVLVAAPPNPVERLIILSFKQQLEKQLGRKVDFQILFNSDQGIVDLTKLSEEYYKRLCYEYARVLNDPDRLRRYNQSYHLNTIVQHTSEIIGNTRMLVVPFQTTEYHVDALDNLINEERVVLPSIPNVDKATNNFLLKENGYSDLPLMLVVSSNGDVLTTSEELKRFNEESHYPLPANEDNVTVFAEALLNAIDRLVEEGKKAYVKLDSNGVSGLGNLVPTIYADIYDSTKTREERLSALKTVIFNNYRGGFLPRTAVVEEFIDARKRQGIKHDITVGGVMIGGIFFPMSCFPFEVNNNDEYVAGWMARNPEIIGESKEEWHQLFRSFAQMGRIMGRAGYTDGILAGDVLFDVNGGIFLHDYNFRRGGRSYLETMIALLPETEGLFEAQIEIESPQGLKNEERYQLYTAICKELFENGIFPFSTAFGYFGGDHEKGKPDFLKFKLAVPTNHSLISDKPRNKHFPAVETYVNSLIKTNA